VGSTGNGRRVPLLVVAGGGCDLGEPVNVCRSARAPTLRSNVRRSSAPPPPGLGQVEQCGTEALPGAGRIDVELVDPPGAEDEQGHDGPFGTVGTHTSHPAMTRAKWARTSSSLWTGAGMAGTAARLERSHSSATCPLLCGGPSGDTGVDVRQHLPSLPERAGALDSAHSVEDFAAVGVDRLTVRDAERSDAR